MEKEAPVARSAGVVGAVTLASRLLGLVRDVLFARLMFGAALDAFVVAFTIPNLFRRLFGEGALSAAFVPAFVARREAGEMEKAERLTRSLGTLVLIGLGAAAAAVSVIALVVCAVVKSLTLELLAIMMPYAALICTAAVLGGALNAQGYFAVPALAPAVLNVFMIGALVMRGTSPHVVAVSVLLGGVVQLAMHALLLPRAGVGLRPSLRARDEGVREVGRAFLPVALAAAVFQLNVLADRLIAAWLVEGEGGVSSLYLGNRLVQLPLALFAISSAVAALPKLSKHASKKDLAGFRKSLAESLTLSAFLLIPSAVGLGIVCDAGVQLLFEGGRFMTNSLSTGRTSLVVAFYAAGLVPYGLAVVLARAFYALGDRKTPVAASVVSLGTNVVLNIILVRVFNRWMVGEAGLALASAAAGAVYFGLLVSGLWSKKEMGGRGGGNAAVSKYALGALLVSSGALGYALAAGYYEKLLGAVRIKLTDVVVGDGVELATAAGSALTVSLIFVTAWLAYVSYASKEENLKRLVGSTARIVLSSALMGLFAHWVVWSLPPDGEGFLVPLQRVVAPVVLGGLGYWFLVGIFAPAEYEALRAAVRGKATRIPPSP